MNRRAQAEAHLLQLEEGDARAFEEGDVLLFGAAARAALRFRDAPGANFQDGMTRAQRAVPYYGRYRLRGRWLHERYTLMRNAAWAVRNSRVGAEFNPIALQLVLAEAERLVASGEPLIDVLEAFAELLTRP
jgi:hypothetical protein